jgi:hypothetical protein
MLDIMRKYELGAALSGSTVASFWRQSTTALSMAVVSSAREAEVMILGKRWMRGSQGVAP